MSEIRTGQVIFQVCIFR